MCCFVLLHGVMSVRFFSVPIQRRLRLLRTAELPRIIAHSIKQILKPKYFCCFLSPFRFNQDRYIYKQINPPFIHPLNNHYSNNENMLTAKIISGIAKAILPIDVTPCRSTQILYFLCANNRRHMSIMNNRRGDRKPANPFYGGKLHSTLNRNTPQKPYPFETANSQFAHIWSRKGFKPSGLRLGTSTPEVRCPKSVIRSPKS